MKSSENIILPSNPISPFANPEEKFSMDSNNGI